MACNKSCENVGGHKPKHGFDYIIIIVLYILLAIILGSCIY